MSLYFFTGEPGSETSWYAARQICSDNGAILAQPKNEEQLGIIHNMINTNPQYGVSESTLLYKIMSFLKQRR